MRILHTSDWHLGKVLFEQSLLDEQRHALARLLAHLLEQPHDALIVAGDVFDRTIPPEDAVRLLGSWLQQLRAALPHLPVVVIAGNHDSAARLSWGAGLLAAMGVHIRGDTEGMDVPVRIRTAMGELGEIWCVPFLWPGALPSDEAMPTQAGALEAAVARVRGRATPGHTQVLVAHGFVRGGLASDSERTLVGQATQVEARLFDGFDYVALGHLHRPQRVAPRVHYSGSLCTYSFSEVGHDKVALSVEVRAGLDPLVEPLPLPPRRVFRVLEGTLEHLCTDPSLAAFAEDYLAIRLTEPTSLAPMATLRKRFPNLLHLINPVELAVTGRIQPRAATDDATDIGDDARSFLAHVRGDAPDEGTLSLFDTLRIAAEETSA